MAKNILRLFLFIVLVAASPKYVYGETNTDTEYINDGFQGISISVIGSTLHISGANGSVLRVYDLTGVCLLNFKIDGQEKQYNLSLARGCYIVKVGNVVRKIAVR